MTQKLIGNLNKGLFFVVSAPSGTGKTTLIRMLTKEFSNIVESVSYTTRKIRPGEKDGVDYHFINVEEFENKIKEDEFLEYAKVFDHYYGTSKKIVEKDLLAKKHVVLVIDTQGAMKVKQKVDANFIFILPPSLEELKNRLDIRNSDKDVETRLDWAKKEMQKSKNYDYWIVNDDLKIAYEVLKSVFIAIEHKVKK